MDPTPPSPPLSPPKKAKKPGITGGLILIVIGALFLLNNFIPDFDVCDYWPLILVAIGASLLWNSWRKKQEG
jgi:hypothetical protein